MAHIFLTCRLCFRFVCPLPSVTRVLPAISFTENRELCSKKSVFHGNGSFKSAKEGTSFNKIFSIALAT